MAIAHLHAAVVQRSAGQSAVGAAAYAARARILDERTGVVHDYSRKNADVMFSFVGLPKGAPDRLLDPAVFANALEAKETRKNSQTARKFTMALPHELTDEQRGWLIKDFGRENFTRKGLAYHVAIHRPHEYGDQRNIHAHWTVSTRVLDKTGFTEKYREGSFSERQAALLTLRDNWEKLVNRHLERHGYATRISMKTLEAQGIDRTPQIHMGQAASALERKGSETELGELLRSIANDNEQGQGTANDLKVAEGSELNRVAGSPAEMPLAPVQPRQPANDNARQPVIEPEIIDRDRQEAEWQDALDRAAIAYADEQRQQLRQSQADARTEFEGRGAAMAARHTATWTETAHRHAAELAEIVAIAPASYQPGTMAEAEEAATGSMSFLLGLFASWAESITRSVSGAKGQPQTRRTRGPDAAKVQTAQRQLQEAHSRELEALMQEQAREREAYERRRAQMLFQQAGAMQSFEQDVADKSSLREAFDRHTERIESTKAYQTEKAEQKAMRDGPGYDGLELG